MATEYTFVVGVEDSDEVVRCQKELSITVNDAVPPPAFQNEEISYCCTCSDSVDSFENEEVSYCCVCE